MIVGRLASRQVAFHSSAEAEQIRVGNGFISGGVVADPLASSDALCRFPQRRSALDA
jgi:hypothetical protein